MCRRQTLDPVALSWKHAGQDDAIDKLRDIFDKVFHHMATRVLAETKFEEETHVAKVANKLRELANLHFTQ